MVSFLSKGDSHFFPLSVSSNFMQSPESQFVIDFYSFGQVTCVDFASICIFFFFIYSQGLWELCMLQ